MEETESGNCGAGCDCTKPSGNRKIKAAVCLVVLLGIGGIFVYKAQSARQDRAARAEAGFAASACCPTTACEAAPAIEDTEEAGGACKSLDSLAALTALAADEDAVFVFIPSKGGDAAGKEATDAIALARKRIESTGARIGVYTLQETSVEYANIAEQISAPGMLVMSKGRGMGTVSGEITETKILQAYVASSRVSSCGPAGCGPAGCD